MTSRGAGMPDKSATERATLPALVATALIAIAGNTNVLGTGGADKTLVHGLVTQLQTDVRACHDARHELGKAMEARQAAFEEHMEGRLDDLEEDIVISGKEDGAEPRSTPYFVPPGPPRHLDAPKAAGKPSPKVSVDDLLE